MNTFSTELVNIWKGHLGINQIPSSQLEIVKRVPNNQRLPSRDLAKKLKPWLGPHQIREWVEISNHRWYDERAADIRATQT